MSPICRVLAGFAFAAALLTSATVPVSADQGSGNPILEVSANTLPPDRVSEITVAGTDYLVPPHAPGVDVFGGVYVFFGWVADPDHFGPSIRNSINNDGTFGVTYAYPGEGGDPSTRDDGTGSVRLVSFTEGGESGDATEFHMDDHGNWTTTVRVYGSTFTTIDPVTDERATYDCTQVQCGVFTIGAHGKASATNEKFTPITFSATAALPPPPTATPTTAPPATSTPADAAPTVPSSTSLPTTIGTSPPTRAATSTSTSAAPTTTTSNTASAASADGNDGDPPNDHAIDAQVASVTSTGGGVNPLVVAAGALAVAAVAAWLVLTRRRRTRSAATTAHTIPPTAQGGTTP